MKCTKEYRLSNTKKAQKILEQLTLEEKIYLMSGNLTPEDRKEEMKKRKESREFHYGYKPYEAGGFEKHGLEPMKFCDGPRGVVCGTDKTTCFPVAMLRGATFDTELEEKIGEAIAEEILALGGNLFAGVCINLPYNPGWGRCQETYGEDSFHLGEMGSAMVRGVQSKNVMACIKHFAFNQMEISRLEVDIDCDKRTEREVFLPHFKKCIDNGAAVVMSSYNLYQGTHCGHSDYLLNKVLKEEWGFDGFVISDFGYGIRETVEAANGGQNIEMSFTNHFGEPLIKAVKEGKVPEQVIDDAALRIIRTILSFTEQGGPGFGEEVLANREHTNLALQCAREGMVLIQNEKHVLPAKKQGKVLVLGRMGKDIPTGDHGSSWVFPPYIRIPLHSLKECAPEAEIIYYDGENLEHAKELASEADFVIFVVGYDYKDEGEYISVEQVKMDGYAEACGGDRDHLCLRENEQTLLKEVGPLNANSVAVLIGGSTILIDDWKDCVSAILVGFYPGMEGGTALAELFFGDVSPSGKLPFVIPKDENDLPQVEWRTKKQHYEYYHGYHKLEKEGKRISVPYGYGLSYTSFAFSNPLFSTDGTSVTASCDICNSGKREGVEVVQMYVGFSNSRIDRPLKTLTGFRRVALQPGETKRVEITCSTNELCWYNEEAGRMELECMEYEVYIGNSSAEDDLLKGSVTL